MKKFFSNVEIEIMLLGEADVIRTSAEEETNSPSVTTDLTTSATIDNADDLPWDTME